MKKMSTSTTPVESSTKLGIVAKIMKVLKLDDEGKVGKFFAKEVKKFTTAIRDLKNNVQATVNVYESALEQMNDRLEDAKESLEAAYQAVTVEDIPTNEKMETFSEKYWRKVEAAEYKVANIEEEIKQALEDHEEELKDLNEQIAKYQTRIDRINAA